MALNGIDPVIIFTLGKKIKATIGTEEKEVFTPVAPIPFYLSESLFEIVIDEPEQSINIDIEATDKKNYEKHNGSDVRFTIRAQKNNVMVKAFLALFETVYNQADAAYMMTVYYDDVFMLDASLRDFSKRIIEGTDTREISFTLTNRPSSGIIKDYILKDVTDSLANAPVAAG